MLTEKDLKEIRHNLAHLSEPAVRDAYERAYQDCRMIYGRVPCPKSIQIGASLATALEVALNAICGNLKAIEICTSLAEPII